MGEQPQGGEWEGWKGGSDEKGMRKGEVVEGSEVVVAGGKGGWDPTRGFRVQDAKKGGLRSGPTPAVRQAFERPVRTAMQGARLVGRGARAVGSVISGLAALGRLK